MNTKICARCGQDLPRTAFNRRTDARDGYQSYCRACSARALVERGPVPRGRRSVTDKRKDRR